MGWSQSYKLLWRLSLTSWILSIMCCTCWFTSWNNGIYLLGLLSFVWTVLKEELRMSLWLQLSELPMTVYVPAYLFVLISCILKLKKLNYLALNLSVLFLLWQYLYTGYIYLKKKAIKIVKYNVKMLRPIDDIIIYEVNFKNKTIKFNKICYMISQNYKEIPLFSRS